jgi:hypothetical protein
MAYETAGTGKPETKPIELAEIEVGTGEIDPTENVPTETCMPVSVAVIVGSVMLCFAVDCVFT